MRVEKITFMQTFPTGQYANQKLGVEIIMHEVHPVNESSAVADAFERAKKLVEESFKALNPHLSAVPDGQGFDARFYSQSSARASEQVDTVIGIISDLNKCTVIDEKNSLGVQVGLLSYESTANSDPRIKEAYEAKLAELSKN